MEFVEQLKSSVDIVTVVGEYVRLRKAGVRHVGLCPFPADEKTPSFSVHGAISSINASAAASAETSSSSS